MQQIMVDFQYHKKFNPKLFIFVKKDINLVCQKIKVYQNGVLNEQKQI